MSIAQFFSRPGGATSDTKRQKTTQDVPPEEPRTIVVWNANSLLSRVDSNRDELRAFIEKTSPDVLFVSEVRMPAAGPPGSKVGDGKPRTHGTLSRATTALAEEAERVKTFCSQLGYRTYWSLAEKKYAGCALLVKRSCVQPTLRFNLEEEQPERQPGGQEAPPEQHDREGRVILASFGSFDFLGTYVPNQGSSEDSFARRRGWDAKMRSLLASRAAGTPRPLVWGGDLNVAAGWEDVGPDPEWFRSKNGQAARCAEERGQPGFTQAEQARFADLMHAGELLDAHRLLHPTPDWKRDATWRGTPGAPPNPPEYGRYFGKGMRIDYVLIHRQLRARLVRTQVFGHGAERHGFLGSDHCPLLLELAHHAPPAAATDGGGFSSLQYAAADVLDDAPHASTSSGSQF